MNAGLLLYLGDGRVQTSAANPFSRAPNAIPFLDGRICINTMLNMNPVAWVSGMPYGSNGRISCQPNPAVPIAYYIAGLGITAAGRLAVDETAPIAGFIRGIPISAAGRVCIAPQVDLELEEEEL